MMAGSVFLCHCRCHSVHRADWHAARQMNDWNTALVASSDPLINANIPVDARDPLEAAAACEACRHNHSVALSDNPQPPPYLPPTNWNPQADGDDAN